MRIALGALRSGVHCDLGVNANGTLMPFARMYNCGVCMYICTAPGAQRQRTWRELRDVDYADAVGVTAHVLVAACSACAGVICVDVIKRCIAVCIYAHMHG